MGVRPGMPDIMIFEPGFDYNIPPDEWNPLIEDLFYDDAVGLAIELKIKPNKPTKAQLEVLEALKKANWSTHICYDFDKAKQAIDNYLDK